MATDWTRLESMPDSELLAALLGKGQLYKRLGCRGSLDSYSKMTFRDLIDLPGVPPAQAKRLAAVLELARRLARGRGPRIVTAEDVVGLVLDMHELRQETFRVLCLDGAHRLVGIETISTGTLTHTLVHPREVFRKAIELSAAAIVAVHNHPSGDPTASADDHLLTRRLREAGKLLGIELLDHIVVARSGFNSLLPGLTWQHSA